MHSRPLLVPEEPVDLRSVGEHHGPTRAELALLERALRVLDVVLGTANRSTIRPAIYATLRCRTMRLVLTPRPPGRLVGTELVDGDLDAAGDLPDPLVQVRGDALDVVLLAVRVAEH